jgi:chromosome segregation ATPase
VILPKPTDTRQEPLQQTIGGTSEHSRDRGFLSRLLSRLFSRPSSPARAIWEAIDLLGKTSEGLVNRVDHLIISMQLQNDSRVELAKARQADARWIQSVEERFSANQVTLNILQDVVADSAQGLPQLREQADKIDLNLTGLNKHVTNLEKDVIAHLLRLQKHADDLGLHVTSLDKEMRPAIAHMLRLQRQVDSMGLHLTSLDEKVRPAHHDMQLLRMELEQVAGCVCRLQEQTDSSNVYTADWNSQLNAAIKHLLQLQGQTDRIGLHLINLDKEANPAIKDIQLLRSDTDRIANQCKDLQQQINRVAVRLFTAQRNFAANATAEQQV